MVNVERWARWGRAFMALWVLFALPTVVNILQTGLGGTQLAVAFGFSVWGIAWAWFWLRAVGRSHAGEVVALVANTVVLSLFALVAPIPVGVGGVLVFSFIIAGAAFPLRRALWVLLGLTVLQTALTFVRLENPTTGISSLLNSVLVGGIGVGARLLWQSYAQLVSAREQLAELAVTEERLRFARDLHDLLGQSLSVLVLKSELVARLLPEDSDETLRQDVRDIASVARKSLNDVREAVAGYRRATLQTEISSARSALRAAGIGLVVEDTIGPLAPEQDGVLAWCLREAVTNVLRHSGAKTCEVRLSRADGMASLDVMDDGLGAASLNGGSGLDGMRERVRQVGGTLRVDFAGRAGLHVQVAVPSPA